MWRRNKEKNESEIEHFDISREFTTLTIVLAIALTIVEEFFVVVLHVKHSRR